jgi:antitoxin HicB
MRYPVTLTRDDNDTIVVTFPDVPEAVTYGDTRDEALARAPDALLTIFDAFMKDRRPIPPPSPVASGHPAIDVPALESTKIALYQAMRTADISKSELARRLHWHPPQVDRLFAIRHGSKLDQLEAAFGALGKRLVVDVQDMRPAGGRVQYFATPRAGFRKEKPNARKLGRRRRRTKRAR